jgi:hypothetical protein
MSQTANIVLICDSCGIEGDAVKTHVIRVDGQMVNVELCEREFVDLQARLLPVIEVGRRTKVPSR